MHYKKNELNATAYLLTMFGASVLASYLHNKKNLTVEEASHEAAIYMLDLSQVDEPNQRKYEYNQVRSEIKIFFERESELNHRVSMNKAN